MSVVTRRVTTSARPRLLHVLRYLLELSLELDDVIVNASQERAIAGDEACHSNSLFYLRVGGAAEMIMKRQVPQYPAVGYN
mgnify:CR=1 FL=1